MNCCCLIEVVGIRKCKAFEIWITGNRLCYCLFSVDNAHALVWYLHSFQSYYSHLVMYYLSIMIQCRELIHNEGLREEQIVAAEKVIRLLYPSERNINSFLQQDSRLRFPDLTPSMIAASTILYFVKPWWLIIIYLFLSYS